jgi:hypothetical protein
MNKKRVNKLIYKYLEGETTLEEEQELREYLNRADLPVDMKTYADLFQYYDEVKETDTARDFDPTAKINFKNDAQKSYSEGSESGLAKEGSEPEQGKIKVMAAENINSRVMYDPFNNKFQNKFTWPLRIAAGFILLLVGFAAGQFMNGNGEEYASTQQVAALEQEVQQMKKALMNTGNFRVSSAGERISAVNISSQLPAGEDPDDQITDILLHTLNNDRSVNVRMAAADALFRFRQVPRIKAGLINSLGGQQDPLVQITLIEILVEIKAKSAINEMQKLLVDSETEEVVRKRLEAGIAELKA